VEEGKGAAGEGRSETRGGGGGEEKRRGGGGARDGWCGTVRGRRRRRRRRAPVRPRPYGGLTPPLATPGREVGMATRFWATMVTHAGGKGTAGIRIAGLRYARGMGRWAGPLMGAGGRGTTEPLAAARARQDGLQNAS
jgi:hypothetical protein